MRARVEQCRRLAKSTSDTDAANVLQRMADEIEAEANRIEAVQGSDETNDE